MIYFQFDQIVKIDTLVWTWLFVDEREAGLRFKVGDWPADWLSRIKTIPHHIAFSAICTTFVSVRLTLYTLFGLRRSWRLWFANFGEVVRLWEDDDGDLPPNNLFLDGEEFSAGACKRFGVPPQRRAVPRGCFCRDLWCFTLPPSHPANER